MMDHFLSSISIEDLWAGYGSNRVLRGLYLNLDDGCSLGIFGPNGAGKSTLFKVILGLVPAFQGSLTVAGRRIVTEKDRTWVRRQVGYVPQQSVRGKLPLSVGDAVLMGRWGKTFGFLKRPHEEDQRAVGQILKEVGLFHKEKADCRSLSGGELQKVAIGRALVRNPSIMLLDEPTTYLDSRAKAELVEMICRIRNERKISLITISHDPAHLEEIADSVLQLEDGRLKGRP